MSDQATFCAGLLDPEHPLPVGLIDSQNRPAVHRFGVYRNNVAVALGDALRAGFPVISRLLGEDNFKATASIFLRKHPPTSPIMAAYGDAFPKFLAGFSPLQSLGYLADVATLENLIRQSYHAADAAPIDSQHFQAFATEDLPRAQLSLAPSMRLLSSSWPVYDIWRFNMQDDGPKPRVEPQDIAVFRAAFDPVPVLLPAGSHAFLAALQEGANLEKATQKGSKASVSFDLSAILGILLAHDAITDIHIKFHTR